MNPSASHNFNLSQGHQVGEQCRSRNSVRQPSRKGTCFASTMSPPASRHASSTSDNTSSQPGRWSLTLYHLPRTKSETKTTTLSLAASIALPELLTGMWSGTPSRSSFKPCPGAINNFRRRGNSGSPWTPYARPIMASTCARLASRLLPSHPQ